MPVEIRVYPNQLNRAEFELLGCAAGTTLHNYLLSNVPAYHARPIPLFSVLLNNEVLPFAEWPVVQFADGDLVECMVEPKDPVTAVMVVIAVASAAYAIHVANQPLPDTYNTTSPSGSSIYDANAQGNRPRLMGVVPVLFGRHKVFGDYLNPPKVVYRDNEQVLYVMLSLGVGEFELGVDDIFIGDTKISQYGAAVNYQIFQPGEDVSSNVSHLAEYRSVEVGSTSASQGLKIAGPVYEYITGDYQGGPEYTFEIQPNKKELAFMLAGTSYQQWDADYQGKIGGSLVGKAIELFTTASGAYGVFRVVSFRNNNEIALLERLLPDGTVDNVWSGFADPAYAHYQAAFRVVESVEADRFVGPYLSVPHAVSTNKFTLDFRFNQGLTQLVNGVPQPRTIDLEIQWRNEGDSSWVTVNKSYTAATVDQLAYTFDVAVADGSRPEVRIRRLNADLNDITYKDEIDWVGLRTALPSAASYEGITTLAIEISGTNELAGSAENKVSVIPTRKLLYFDGVGQMTNFGPTRAISSAVYSVATELGYDLDLDELWRLHKIWESRGDYFDGVFDNSNTVWKVLQQMLSVGFAEPTLDFGKIIPVRDEARSVLNYQYQADNILPKTWKMDGSFFDDSESDGIEVEFFSDESWKPETVLCLLPGDAGNNPERVRAFGVTNKTQAYRFGMRKRATQRHRRIRHSFSTEMDALNSRYMSYDALGIDMPGYSQTGRVESVVGREIQLNQGLEWGVGVHYIGIRRPDGTLSGPYQCVLGSGSSSVVIDSDLDFVPVFNGSHEPPYFMFGEADEWCVPVLVTEIKPTGTDKVKVTAFEYSSDVYLYDDAVPLV